MSERYQAFEIVVLQRTDAVYPLLAQGSGDATYRGSMPVTALAGLRADHWLERGLREPATLRELGSQLFDALFPQDILTGFRSSLSAAWAAGQDVRLVLTLEPPELAGLPWELLYDHHPGYERFVARSATTPIVRHLSTPTRVRPPIKGTALRVLIALAEPKRLPPLGADYEEAQAITQALSRGPIDVDVERLSAGSRVGRGLRNAGAALRALVVGQGRVRVKLVEHATRSTLRNALREAERAGQGYHIVHFIGHGAGNESGGYLILEGKDGMPDAVPAEQVAEMLDGTGVNMVFLNACASAREGQVGPDFYSFRGVAQACINLGLRAALAMQVDIVDSVAGEFAREFYTSLADGEEVEKAVLDARHQVGKDETADWAVPVLYSRAPRGSILAPELTSPPKSLWARVVGLGQGVRRHPVVALLLGLFSALALLLGVVLDIQDARQPGGPLHALWPAPTATATPLPPMSEGFNVAVAQFPALDATGQLTVTEETRELSDWLYRAIKAERDRLPAAQTFELRGPDDVRPVEGVDPDTRDADARELAQQHNATLLIYGLVGSDAGGYWVQPSFTVLDEAFGYGSEVGGPERLGLPVPFEPPLSQPGTLGSINTTLDARVQALGHVVAGLGFFYQERCEEAWAAFRQAALVPGWQAEEGKEVVYLLMGAARLKQYNTQEDDARYLADAADAFAEALRLNSKYARSYLGLGSVALLQAVRAGASRPDEEKLLEARGWYLASLQAADQPASAFVPVRANFGLGEVYLEGSENLPGWPGAEARRYLEQVVAAYQEERDAREPEPVPPELIWFAGNATALLGRLDGAAGNWAGMSAACRQGIELLNSLPGRSQQVTIARYWSWVARAEEKVENLKFAQDALWQAIQLGNGLVSQEELERWQNDLNRLEKGTP